jgi:branched-chain amino acid transport system permease protein
VAAFVGLFCTRQIEIYFAMLTLAFGELLFALCSKFYDVTGGTDGIRVKMPTLFGYVFKGGTEYYYFVFVLFLLCTLAIWVICNSPFGKTIQAVRDNEVRVGYLGLLVMKYRLIAFIISGAFTGLAGVLVVSLTGHATPELFQVFTSISIVFMVILGGHTSFLGPVVGAIVFVFLQSWLKPLFFWQFFLGVSIILLVIFLPGGVLGGVSIWVRKALAKISS